MSDTHRVLFIRLSPGLPCRVLLIRFSPGLHHPTLAGYSSSGSHRAFIIRLLPGILYHLALAFIIRLLSGLPRRVLASHPEGPKSQQAKAVRTTVYLQNRTSANGGVSPHELYFGKKRNLAHLRIFGSIAYVHVSKEKRRKLDAKAEKCILVGYSDEQKGYKCYHP